jgi:hypothetical protein
LTYGLVSIIQHRAHDEFSGHYFTDVLIGEKFKRFDDQTVGDAPYPCNPDAPACRSKIIDSEVQWQDSPTLLFYQVKAMCIKGEEKAQQASLPESQPLQAKPGQAKPGQAKPGSNRGKKRPVS